MKKELTYLESVHKDGKIWGFTLFAVILLFPLVVSFVFDAMPNWSAFAQGILTVGPTYWIVSVVEVITYVPMLGAGGSYLSFVTGNISNLKLPCALEVLENTGYKSSTEEGEIISTISIAVSSIVTTVIIILGVILLVPLEPLLANPVLEPAFEQLLPALFGALGVVFVSKNWKIAIAPITLMLVLFIAVPALNAGTVGIMVPVGALFTIGASRIMYKKGMLDDKKNLDKQASEEITE